MRTLRLILLPVVVFIPALAQSPGPFLGRWDFNVTSPGGVGANWLAVSQGAQGVEVFFQPTGGHVVPLKDFKIAGSHMTLKPSADTTWELDAAGGRLTGKQNRGDRSLPITGVRAPELPAHAIAAWSKPETLFNGKNLDGWESIGDPKNSHWIVKDGILVNEDHGANLKTIRKFQDFKLHFEVNCPDLANSGFYLRGRYEVQLENEPEGSEPPERGMGSIYGRLAPNPMGKRHPGEWDAFDVTLVGREVTISRNGVLTIDHKIIEGITGGAIDANEGEPGVFYIQGDHTGGLMFRNITVQEPKP
jgi:hypothetical protein